MKSKHSAKRAKAKRYDLEKEIYALQNKLEILRKSRAVIEDQNQKLEKVKIEREEQISAMNLKIQDKEEEVREAEEVLENIENTIKEIVETALC